MKAEWVPDRYVNLFIMKRIWPAVRCVHNVLVHAMEAQGGVTWARSGVVWPASRLGRFSSDSHRIGDWIGTRAWLRHFELKQNLLPLPGIEPWFLRCPARSLVTTSTEVSQLIKKNSTLNFMIIFSTELTRAHSETEIIIYLFITYYMIRHKRARNQLKCTPGRIDF
jgi:hypothetical protein